jgi:hypothetical protein
MRLIRESIGATRIDTVVRQRQAWACEVPSALARGNARQALEAFADRELIHAHHGSRATVQAPTDKWQQLVDKTSDRDVLVVAKTNAEVRAMSAAIRVASRSIAERARSVPSKRREAPTSATRYLILRSQPRLAWVPARGRYSAPSHPA